MTARTRAAAVLFAAVTVATSATASGEHSAEEHITDGTPYVLRPGEVRLGLWRSEFGLANELRGLDVGTYHLPWIGWAFGVRIVNLHAKYQLLERGRFAASAGAGLFTVSLDNLDVPVSFVGMPFDVLAAYRASSAFTFSGGLQGTWMRVSGAAVYDDDRFRGAVAANSLQALASLEWRVGRVTALVATARLMAYTTLSGAADAHLELTSHTEIDAYAAGEADVTGGVGGALGAYVHWSWDHFNLKLGGSYGTYSVPGINLVVPTSIFMPEVDLFWRF